MPCWKGKARQKVGLLLPMSSNRFIAINSDEILQEAPSSLQDAIAYGVHVYVLTMFVQKYHALGLDRVWGSKVDTLSDSELEAVVLGARCANVDRSVTLNSA